MPLPASLFLLLSPQRYAPPLCPVIKSRFPVISAPSRSRSAFYLFTLYARTCFSPAVNAFSMLFSMRLCYAFVETRNSLYFVYLFLISGNTLGEDGTRCWDVGENCFIELNSLVIFLFLFFFFRSLFLFPFIIMLKEINVRVTIFELFIDNK